MVAYEYFLKVEKPTWSLISSHITPNLQATHLLSLESLN